MFALRCLKPNPPRGVVLRGCALRLLTRSVPGLFVPTSTAYRPRACLCVLQLVCKRPLHSWLAWPVCVFPGWPEAYACQQAQLSGRWRRRPAAKAACLCMSCTTPAVEVAGCLPAQGKSRQVSLQPGRLRRLAGWIADGTGWSPLGVVRQAHGPRLEPCVCWGAAQCVALCMATVWHMRLVEGSGVCCNLAASHERGSVLCTAVLTGVCMYSLLHPFAWRCSPGGRRVAAMAVRVGGAWGWGGGRSPWSVSSPGPWLPCDQPFLPQ